jgi:hypothetical protein
MLPNDQSEKELPMSGVVGGEGRQSALKAHAAASMGFLGIRVANAFFNEPDGAAGSATKEVVVSLLEGTQRYVLSLGNWYFQFGPSDAPIERPLSHIGMGFGAGAVVGTDLTVVIRALLRDADGAEPWKGRVQVVVQCYG